ncbi:MAG: two-component system, OmpR family, phosphate regulon response regulator PhoB [Desulfomicrobiaceae bacterium]|jgi:two-component system phosphate regulon response regulator PhoB|nr:two-component system, OmpR family, phosphate regulon response regulator PhoB [Desulfomicrobiaceae bacterium]
MADNILVIEDDADIANLLAFHIKAAGYGCTVARDGKTGVRLAQSERPSLILLDLMLPGMSGLEVCKTLKSSPETDHIPIIMLTARGDEVDRVLGFELGAEDYVVKPFSPRELMLRIKNVLRRRAVHTGAPQRWERDGLVADFEAHILYVDGEDVHLTRTEFALLAELVHREGKALSREHLLSTVWGYEFEGYSRTVDTHVRRLRRKMGPYADLIETVRGIGYRLQRAKEGA